jgi:outer membrane protein assembly factor BamD (BamD/ComL family)
VASVAGREAERTLDQAGDLRRRDPRRALAMYRRMLAGGGPLAEIAQYEIGVIEDEDLRNPRQAVATWDRYRARYPGGLLRTEADLSVIEALSRVGEQGRALAEARDFLQRHPSSERRSEVARLAGDLTRERGDCAGAVALYDQALSSRPATDDADDASFHRATCLARAGDPRGSAGLREYLKRFPLGRHAGQAQRLLARPAAR